MDYLVLMQSFNSRAITATEFESKYLAIFKSDQRSFPTEVFEVLNQLFTDVDVFVADPRIRGEKGLDEEQLLTCCRQAYEKLLTLLV
jgi:hypothetical protein